MLKNEIFQKLKKIYFEIYKTDYSDMSIIQFPLIVKISYKLIILVWEEDDRFYFYHMLKFTSRFQYLAVLTLFIPTIIYKYLVSR